MNKVQSSLAKGFALTANGCLLVSLFQASGQAIENVEDPLLKISIVAGIAFALLTSQLLIRSLGALWNAQRGFMWAIAFAVLIGVSWVIETYSVQTSTTSVDGGFMRSQRNENLNSPERKQFEKKIDRLEDRVAASESQKRKLMEQRNRMPDDWAKRIKEVEKRIDTKRYEIDQAEAQIAELTGQKNSVDVSISRAAFKNLEAKTGLSQTDSILIFALLMSICPIAVRLVQGVIEAGHRPMVSAGGAIHIDADEPAEGPVSKKWSQLREKMNG